MVNPFRYGGVVSQEAFCNRQQELADLRHVARNAGKVFVYAERRMGKTSLIKQVLGSLPARDYLPIYIDLWPTDGAVSFAITVANAIAEAATTRMEKVLEMAKSLYAHLVPSLTLDEAGNPILSLGVGTAPQQELLLAEVLAAPAKIAAREKRRLVVVYDEFQRIMEYDTDHVERALRSAVQQHEEVAYIFLGSRKHLIQRMFLDADRPLYRSAGHYPLASIATEHWKPFIRNGFANARKLIRNTEIEALCKLTEGHPFYTQHLAHELWQRTGATVTAGTLEDALDIVLRREAHAYITLWDTLTKNQRRLLRGLASAPEGTRPFSSEFVQRFGLRTPSNAQSAAKSLLEKDVIDRADGALFVSDRFFKSWIERL